MHHMHVVMFSSAVNELMNESSIQLSTVLGINKTVIKSLSQPDPIGRGQTTLSLLLPGTNSPLSFTTLLVSLLYHNYTQASQAIVFWLLSRQSTNSTNKYKILSPVRLNIRSKSGPNESPNNTINGDSLVQKKHQHMRLGTQDVNNILFSL